MLPHFNYPSPPKSEKLNRLNIRIKIDDVYYEIKDIIIDNNTTNVLSGSVSQQLNTNRSIKIIAETSNQNIDKVDSWFNNIHNSTKYKKDVILRNIQIIGLFPIDYNFNQYCIKVDFSADYINGDLMSLQLQQIRKKKLIQLDKISKRNK